MVTIKTQSYDDFRCIADRCPMTCCQGWSIKVDQNTCDKWQKDQNTAYLMEYTVSRGEDVPREMKTNEADACLLLDSQGLCEVVKRHGDGYLCDTCALFPRKKNQITELNDADEEKVLIEEYSLSLSLIHI